MSFVGKQRIYFFKEIFIFIKISAWNAFLGSVSKWFVSFSMFFFLHWCTPHKSDQRKGGSFHLIPFCSALGRWFILGVSFWKIQLPSTRAGSENTITIYIRWGSLSNKTVITFTFLFHFLVFFLIGFYCLLTTIPLFLFMVFISNCRKFIEIVAIKGYYFNLNDMAYLKVNLGFIFAYWRFLSLPMPPKIH